MRKLKITRIVLMIVGLASIHTAYASTSLQLAVPLRGKQFAIGDQVVAYQTRTQEVLAWSESGGVTIPKRQDIGVVTIIDIVDSRFAIIELPNQRTLKPDQEVRLERIN